MNSAKDRIDIAELRKAGRSLTDVILFHHALGVNDGVQALADDLRAGGHQVTVADLFEGKTFANIEDGVAHEEQIGWEEMIRRSEGGDRAAPAGGRDRRVLPWRGVRAAARADA